MAEKKQSKLRYDDFIANVQPDPGKPVATTMLSGFVGRGQEGHARIYPDPSLGTWYDVPEGDIVHTLPRADAPQGGSYVWVKASAQIKPGTTAQAVPVPNPATQSPDNCGLTLFFSCICAQQIDARGMMPAAALHRCKPISCARKALRHSAAARRASTAWRLRVASKPMRRSAPKVCRLSVAARRGSIAPGEARAPPPSRPRRAR